jgi:hypothetical protein
MRTDGVAHTPGGRPLPSRRSAAVDRSSV